MQISEQIPGISLWKHLIMFDVAHNFIAKISVKLGTEKTTNFQWSPLCMFLWACVARRFEPVLCGVLCTIVEATNWDCALKRVCIRTKDSKTLLFGCVFISPSQYAVVDCRSWITSRSLPPLVWPSLLPPPVTCCRWLMNWLCLLWQCAMYASWSKSYKPSARADSKCCVNSTRKCVYARCVCVRQFENNSHI